MTSCVTYVIVCGKLRSHVAGCTVRLFARVQLKVIVRRCGGLLCLYHYSCSIPLAAIVFFVFTDMAVAFHQLQQTRRSLLHTLQDLCLSAMSAVFQQLPQIRRSLVHIFHSLCFHCHVCRIPLAAIDQVVLGTQISGFLFYCHVGSVPLAAIDRPGGPWYTYLRVFAFPVMSVVFHQLPCLQYSTSSDRHIFQVLLCFTAMSIVFLYLPLIPLCPWYTYFRVFVFTAMSVVLYQLQQTKWSLVHRFQDFCFTAMSVVFRQLPQTRWSLVGYTHLRVFFVFPAMPVVFHQLPRLQYSTSCNRPGCTWQATHILGSSLFFLPCLQYSTSCHVCSIPLAAMPVVFHQLPCLQYSTSCNRPGGPWQATHVLGSSLFHCLVYSVPLSAIDQAVLGTHISGSLFSLPCVQCSAGCHRQGGPCYTHLSNFVSLPCLQYSTNCNRPGGPRYTHFRISILLPCQQCFASCHRQGGPWYTYLRIFFVFPAMPVVFHQLPCDR